MASVRKRLFWGNHQQGLLAFLLLCFCFFGEIRMSLGLSVVFAPIETASVNIDDWLHSAMEYRVAVHESNR